MNQSEDDDQSLEPLQDTDVLLVFTRRLNAGGKELDRFKAYCAAGRPIVGVRTASHAYQNWLEFDKAVLGGNYQGHYGAGPIAHAEINPNARNHPILHGISNFNSYGSLYKNPSIATDTTLLLTGKTEEHAEPVAWTRRHRGGRGGSTCRRTNTVPTPASGRRGRRPPRPRPRGRPSRR